MRLSHLLASTLLCSLASLLTACGGGDAPAATPATTTTAARNAALQAALSAIRGRHGDQALYPADAGHERNNATGASTHHPAQRRR